MTIIGHKVRFLTRPEMGQKCRVWENGHEYVTLSVERIQPESALTGSLRVTTTDSTVYVGEFHPDAVSTPRSVFGGGDAAKTMNKEASNWAPGLIGLSILMILLAVWIFEPSTPAKDTPEETADNYDISAYVESQALVKRYLKAPATATFPSKWDDGVEIQHNGTLVTIKSYVDSENSFGAKLRIPYFCAYTKSPGGNCPVKLESFVLDGKVIYDTPVH